MSTAYPYEIRVLCPDGRTRNFYTRHIEDMSGYVWCAKRRVWGTLRKSVDPHMEFIPKARYQLLFRKGES